MNVFDEQSFGDDDRDNNRGACCEAKDNMLTLVNYDELTVVEERHIFGTGDSQNCMQKLLFFKKSYNDNFSTIHGHKSS